MLRLSGVFLTELLASGPGGCIARLEYTDETPAERLAWVTQNPSGSGWVLRVKDAVTTDADLLLAIEPDAESSAVEIEPTAITPFHFDDDGQHDLAISHADFKAIPVLINQLGSQHFVIEDNFRKMQVVPYDALPSAPATSNQAHFAAAKVGDTETDLLIAPIDVNDQLVGIKQAGSVREEMQTIFPHESLDQQGASGVPPACFLSRATYTVGLDAEFGTASDEANLTFWLYDFPWEIVYKNGFQRFDHIQLVVWSQQNPLANSFLEPDPIANFFVPLPDLSNPENWHRAKRLVLPRIPNPEPCIGWHDRRHLWIELRLVMATPTYEVVSASESLFMGFATDKVATVDSCAQVAGEAGPLSYFLEDFVPGIDEAKIGVLEGYSPGDSDPPQGTTLIGAVLFTDFIPPSVPDYEPVYPEACPLPPMVNW